MPGVDGVDGCKHQFNVQNTHHWVEELDTSSYERHELSVKLSPSRVREKHDHHRSHSHD